MKKCTYGSNSIQVCRTPIGEHSFIDKNLCVIEEGCVAGHSRCGFIRLPTARVGPPIPIPKDLCSCRIEGSLRLCPARLLLRNILKHIVLVRLRLVLSSYSLSLQCRGLSYMLARWAPNRKFTGSTAVKFVFCQQRLKVHNREFAV